VVERELTPPAPPLKTRTANSTADSVEFVEHHLEMLHPQVTDRRPQGPYYVDLIAAVGNLQQELFRSSAAGVEGRPAQPNLVENISNRGTCGPIETSLNWGR
jgi:hypothetical protein